MLIRDNRITKRISKAKIQSLESWSHRGYIGFNSRLLTAWEQLVVERGGRSNVGRDDAKRASRERLSTKPSFSFVTIVSSPFSESELGLRIYNFFRVRDGDAAIDVLFDVPRGVRQSFPESREWLCELGCAPRRASIVCITRFTLDCTLQGRNARTES